MAILSAIYLTGLFVVLVGIAAIFEGSIKSPESFGRALLLALTWPVICIILIVHTVMAVFRRSR